MFSSPSKRSLSKHVWSEHVAWSHRLTSLFQRPYLSPILPDVLEIACLSAIILKETDVAGGTSSCTFLVNSLDHKADKTYPIIRTRTTRYGWTRFGWVVNDNKQLERLSDSLSLIVVLLVSQLFSQRCSCPLSYILPDRYHADNLINVERGRSRCHAFWWCRDSIIFTMYGIINTEFVYEILYVCATNTGVNIEVASTFIPF